MSRKELIRAITRVGESRQQKRSVANVIREDGELTGALLKFYVNYLDKTSGSDKRH